ncbi:CocE/NonD family hydrolase [Sporosarcina sp. Te-1]|uniref:CocE/NonD family hydrolase n=1 Tax=Sporosarcina sp. Te-1 TaxID=2818390 RepID=UPI001A9F64D3|nr:CocE/NonD family hydrolase [Sporosarcina sp. Te-1]QTD40017.1 CocE/NonD family hydrolase [Sporosarcina sp. Te-1]
MRRNVIFWPALLVGSFVVFIIGSLIFWNSNNEDSKAAPAVYYKNADMAESGSEPYELEEGVTKAIYDMEEALIEELYVETEVDSDRDGQLDKVFITVVRPPVKEGMKVPAILWMTPYDELHAKYTEHFTVAGADGKTFIDNVDFSGSHFVPRGYGFIAGHSLGTSKSEGCPTTGGREETLAAKAVVDWLNGRAKAYTADGKQVPADWATGDAGMIGGSYDGTLATAVAAEGVEGLKAIVPISSISSWYDYVGANGLYLGSGDEKDFEITYEGAAAGLAELVWNGKSESCTKLFKEMGQVQGEGEYNEFWASRNYLDNYNGADTAVLIAHGQNDPVVRPINYTKLWETLKENNVPRKMWISNGEHRFISTSADFLDWQLYVNRWFDHWLYSIDNGIMEEPHVYVKSNLNTYEMDDWPGEDPEFVTFHLSADGELTENHKEDSSVEESQSFQDGEAMLEFTVAHSPEIDQPNRLIYMTEELESDFQLSGSPEITITASFTDMDAVLSAILVDYSVIPEVVTKGWMNPESRNSIEILEPIVPGESYTLTWNMQPKVYTFQKGHRIGLVIIGSDEHFTGIPAKDITITVQPGLSELVLPVMSQN